MRSWQLLNPTRIVFGTGSIQELGKHLSNIDARKVMMITDQTLSKLGVIERMRQYIPNISVSIYDQVEPNPSSDTIDTATEYTRNERVDAIIGLGGGSCLDTAKVVGLLCCNSGSVVDYLRGELKCTGKGLPLIAVPTTAGTGSEVTSVAVINNTQDQEKQPLSHRYLFPEIALVDPELTWSMPPKVTASTGLDALAHALEAFWALSASPICDTLAIEAVRLVFKNMIVCYHEPQNPSAREEMALASLMAGLAFSQTKTTAPHALSYVLTHRFGVEHGVACALTLAEFAKFNYPALPEKFHHLFGYLKMAGIDELVQEINRLKRETGLPEQLGEAGITFNDLDYLIEHSFHPNIKNNPRSVSKQDLREIYQNIL